MLPQLLMWKWLQWSRTFPDVQETLVLASLGNTGISCMLCSIADSLTISPIIWKGGCLEHSFFTLNIPELGSGSVLVCVNHSTNTKGSVGAFERRFRYDCGSLNITFARPTRFPRRNRCVQDHCIWHLHRLEDIPWNPKFSSSSFTDITTVSNLPFAGCAWNASPVSWSPSTSCASGRCMHTFVHTGMLWNGIEVSSIGWSLPCCNCGSKFSRRRNTFKLQRKSGALWKLEMLARSCDGKGGCFAIKKVLLWCEFVGWGLGFCKIWDCLHAITCLNRPSCSILSSHVTICECSSFLLLAW